MKNSTSNTETITLIRGGSILGRRFYAGKTEKKNNWQNLTILNRHKMYSYGFFKNFRLTWSLFCPEALSLTCYAFYLLI